MSDSVGENRCDLPKPLRRFPGICRFPYPERRLAPLMKPEEPLAIADVVTDGLTSSPYAKVKGSAR